MKEIIEKWAKSYIRNECVTEDQVQEVQEDLSNIMYGLSWLDKDKQEAMEKQPTEYEYVKVSLEQVIEDIMTKKIESYFFIAPDKNEYRVETLSIEQLKLHKDNLYQHVELTPEQLHERKVKELTKIIEPFAYAKCGFTLTKVAEKALEWMELKGR